LYQLDLAKQLKKENYSLQEQVEEQHAELLSLKSKLRVSQADHQLLAERLIDQQRHHTEELKQAQQLRVL
jgi:hypothetical protein